LGSSEFLEATLKNATPVRSISAESRYHRPVSICPRSSPLHAGRYLGIEEKELARPNKRVGIARARALVNFVATQNLSIAGNEVTHRFNVDRSAISRASQRASRDPELPSDTKKF
jgi:hypothetical protein